MRNVSVAVQVVAVVAVFTVSAIGQEVLVSLPIEPVHERLEPTLADAAQRNDFPTFDALYNKSSDRAYAELHDFWKWSLTDRIGAFYGVDMHAKLAAEYPDYAAFIADYEIVDSHGNVFYPSAETRRFLLRHVNVAPHKAPLLAGGQAILPVRAAQKPKPARVTPKVITPAPLPRVVASVPVVTAPVAKPAARPVRVSPIAPTAVDHIDDARLARSLALLIAGLIGLGMLTVMLRTPGEDGRHEEPADPMDAMRIIKLERQAPQGDQGSHSSVA